MLVRLKVLARSSCWKIISKFRSVALAVWRKMSPFVHATDIIRVQPRSQAQKPAYRQRLGPCVIMFAVCRHEPVHDTGRIAKGTFTGPIWASTNRTSGSLDWEERARSRRRLRSSAVLFYNGRHEFARLDHDSSGVCLDVPRSWSWIQRSAPQPLQERSFMAI